MVDKSNMSWIHIIMNMVKSRFSLCVCDGNHDGIVEDIISTLLIMTMMIEMVNVLYGR
jgi:metallophosphoesterase superfamily enzyme